MPRAAGKEPPMRNLRRGPVASTLLVACALVGSATIASAEQTPGTDPIHPEARRTPCPTDGVSVPVNPPPLLWPATRGTHVRYDVRLSRDPTFPEGRTRRATAMAWAMHNPHAALDAGLWHWQYAVRKEPDAKAAWSETHTFRVDAEARAAVTPAAAQVLAACPETHPRLLIAKDDLPALRARWNDTPERERLVKQAKGYLGRKLPDLSRAQPTLKGANDREAKSFAKWASKGFANRLPQAVMALVPAYLLTGDEQYGREAVRWGLFVASLDPDGVTAREVSDFADGACMRAMAIVYDSCYDLLSNTEKQQLRAAMTARGARFYRRMVNNLETRVFNAHVWQHILAEFAEVAFALLGETPEAREWATYVYELWVARFPLMGGDDGGWANGHNYFGTNLETLLVLPTFLGRLADVDLMDQPWYRNVPQFFLYGWPPGSASDGFGDGSERGGPPSASRGYFVETLGRRFGDPYALWYARQVLGNGKDAPRLSPRLDWHRLCRPRRKPLPEPASPADLPAARAFYDVGVVSMHTALGDTSNDLMIGFRSSPYGSTNHMHACQNSFNILYGGKRVLANSGYYIAYGDDHFRGWYKHTRGHNSILIDGKGQAFGAKGYGQVVGFLHGKQISYGVGDASNAYGDAGLTRFRRHVVLLRPGTIVLYDDLAADHPAAWDWLLHSHAELAVEGQSAILRVDTETARARVAIYGSGHLNTRVTNRFDPPAINWRKKTSGGKLIDYPDQWHATVSPRQPARHMRYLAVIQIRPAGEDTPFDEPRGTDDGHVRLGNWYVEAGLSPDEPASLLIRRADGQAALATGVAEVTVAAKEYPLEPGAALLVETKGNIVHRCRDDVRSKP